MSKQEGIEKNRGPYFMDPREIVIIGVDTTDGPEHPLFDVRANLKEFPLNPEILKSYRRWGIRKPIEVTKDGDRYLCNEGRRRVLGARAINVQDGFSPDDVRYIRVRAMIVKDTSENQSLWAVEANEKRESTPAHLKAQQAKILMDKGASIDAVADVYGVTPTTIRTWIRFLGLAPEVQTAVRSGDLAFTEAVKVASESHADQLELMKASVKESMAADLGTSPLTTDQLSASAAKLPTSNPRERKNGKPSTKKYRPTVIELRKLAKQTTDETLEAALLFAAGDLSHEEMQQKIKAWPAGKGSDAS